MSIAVDATSAEGIRAPGWYGKLAFLGDFASRRLPPAATRSIDAWLAQCIASSRGQLGEQWLSVYLTSPLWRFACGPGVIDAAWWFGVMMPSVDNVGRYFPLVVLEACTHPPADAARLADLEGWYARIEAAALRTLQPAALLEGFEAELAQAGSLGDASDAPRRPTIAPSGAWPDRTRYELPATTSLAECLDQLATADTLRRLHGCTLWWARGDADAASSLSLAAGLPAPDSYALMLQGTW